MEFCGHGCRACASLRRHALKIAGEQGLEAVTIAAIADRAQVLAPLVVRHIGDDPMACLCAAYLESMTDLQDRFAATHNIKVVRQHAKTTALPDWLAELNHLDQLLAVWEWRAGPTPWLVMTPKDWK